MTKYALVSFLAPLEDDSSSIPGTLMGKYPTETLFVAEIIDEDNNKLEFELEVSKKAFKRAIDLKGWPKPDDRVR